MSKVRTITKNLAGTEDLLLGKGSVQQARSKGVYDITKLRVPTVVNSITELNALDPEQFPEVVLVEDNEAFLYENIDGTWTLTNFKSGIHIGKPLQEQLASTKLKVGDTVITNGYYEANDGGGATYNVVPKLTGTPDGGSYIDAYNIAVQFELVADGEVNPKQFGAKGDGITDDSSVIQAAIDSSYNVNFIDGIFPCNSLQFTQAFKSYRCYNASLVLNASGAKLAEIKADGVRFYNMIIQGASLSVSETLVKTDAGLRDLEFSGCTFKDLVGTTTSSQYGLFINIYGTSATVSDCKFQNIQSTNTTGLPTSAFCGGLVLFGVGTYTPCDIRVSSCEFENMYTNNILGDIDLSDADGLRVYTDQTVAELNIDISDVYFKGIQKSGIKVSGAQGLNINNVFVDGSRTDLPMISAVRLQRSDRTRLSNVFIKGNLTYAINLRTSNVTVEGVTYVNSANANPNMVMVNLQSLSNAARSADNISLSNITGDTLFRAITFSDVSASGNTRVFSRVQLRNWNVTPRDETSVMYQILNCIDLLLENINVQDLNAQVTDALYITDCDNVTINGCVIGATRYGIYVESTLGSCFHNSSINNTTMVRNTNAQSQVSRFVDVRALSENLKISDLTIRTPMYDALSNTEAIIVTADDLIMSDISIIYENRGGTVRSVSAIQILNSERVNVSNVSMQVEVVAEQTTQYVINAVGCEKSVITNINSNSRGVLMDATSNNYLVDNVAANANTVINNGTNGTVGTAKLWA